MVRDSIYTNPSSLKLEYRPSPVTRRLRTRTPINSSLLSIPRGVGTAPILTHLLPGTFLVWVMESFMAISFLGGDTRNARWNGQS